MLFKNEASSNVATKRVNKWPGIDILRKNNEETPFTHVPCFLLNAWLDSFRVTSTIAYTFQIQQLSFQMVKDHQLLLVLWLASIMDDLFLLRPFRSCGCSRSSSRLCSGTRLVGQKLLRILEEHQENGDVITGSSSFSMGHQSLGHIVPRASRSPSEPPGPAPGHPQAEPRQRGRHKQAECNLHSRSAGPRSNQLR